MNNSLTVEEEGGRDRIAVLPLTSDITLDILRDKLGSFRENRNYKCTYNYNQKDIVEVSGSHTQERGPMEYNTHKAY